MGDMKIGDEVKITDSHDPFYGREGFIIERVDIENAFNSLHGWSVRLEEDEEYLFREEQLTVITEDI